jgi:maltooligosyltrehalose trehalohydrolase
MDHSAEPRSHARVWAPAARVVELATDDGRLFPLEPEARGYFAAELPGLGAGARYRFRLDGDAFPDPASRFQPDGPHGSSMIVDPRAYEWGDNEWPGVSIDDAPVIYELHVGTFTRSGTFRDAIERLPDLVDVGVNVIELMPVADFAGNFGWGYDGVNLFAPNRLYGEPDDLRAFVDAAHRLELGVILDVVYNHFGPDGNYVTKYSRRYMSDTRTEWGEALNFDGDDSGPVREFITSNARYWIEEFHFDGLRLDATQQIYDTSERHILADLADAVRSAARGKRTIVLGENEPQSTALLRSPSTGGCGLDALWNDDFHHSARVAATGRNEAYLSGYTGCAQEFVSTAKYGFLYQGAWYAWQRQRRGTPALDVAPQRFVDFLQNHDQIANSGSGRRLHQETSAGRFRALTALLLLLPQTPMLFQGQEFAASSPFLYFADHTPELARLVREGRAKFVSQFPSIAARDEASRIEEPSDPWTFVRCKLDWAERRRHAHTLDLHRDLLRLRRDDPVLRRSRDRRVDGAVISERAFMIRYFGEGEGDRLLFINLGARTHADPLPEPLIVPPRGAEWRQIFSTESPEYGGWGAPKLETDDDGWWLPAESATLLTSAP